MVNKTVITVGINRLPSWPPVLGQPRARRRSFRLGRAPGRAYSGFKYCRRNLKNYNPDLKVLIPEHLSFFSRPQKRNEWNVIIAMDQSGSMAPSLIYGGVMGAILASMPAVETHVVAFNHQDVVDLTADRHDPVDLLFGIQLGGSEDYWMATCYCERFMHTPARTLYILLADLFDRALMKPSSCRRWSSSSKAE